MKKEENQRSSQSEEKNNVKRILRKRWVVPAVYLIAAAGVLSSIFYLQGADESAVPEDSVEVTDSAQGNGKYDENAIEVTTASETVKQPIEEESNVKVIGNFYDLNATEEEQQKALVYYDNTYYQSEGMDYAHVEGESFNVVASLSGTILKAEKDSLLGYVVEINHDQGVVTHYHSLEEIDVEVGTTVAQGEVIGRAGRNVYNTDAGVHVHFEVRQDGIAVNPNDVFQQPIDFIKDVSSKEDNDKEKEEQATEKSGDEDDQKGVTEEAPKDSEKDQDKDQDKDKDKDEEKENKVS